ncbi:hypothetical protein [Escherichia coli]|nr:hypothetical protein [Escherichia coli]
MFSKLAQISIKAMF